MVSVTDSNVPNFSYNCAASLCWEQGAGFLFENEKLMSFQLCHATECRDLMVSCTDSNVPNFSSNYAVLTCNYAASLCLCWRQNFGSLSHFFKVYLRVLVYSRGRETVSPNVQPKVWLFIYFLIYRSRYFPLVHGQRVWFEDGHFKTQNTYVHIKQYVLAGILCGDWIITDMVRALSLQILWTFAGAVEEDATTTDEEWYTSDQ